MAGHGARSGQHITARRRRIWPRATSCGVDVAWPIPRSGGRAGDPRSPQALLCVLDLDAFQDVNDSRGSAAGETGAKAMARTGISPISR